MTDHEITPFAMATSRLNQRRRWAGTDLRRLKSALDNAKRTGLTQRALSLIRHDASELLDTAQGLGNAIEGMRPHIEQQVSVTAVTPVDNVVALRPPPA